MSILGALLETCDEDLAGVRDRGLLRIAFLSPRLSATALVRLTRDYVVDLGDRFVIHVPDAKDQIEVRGVVRDDIRTWLERLGPGDGPLFPRIREDRAGGRWSSRGIHAMVEDRWRRAVEGGGWEEERRAWEWTAGVPLFVDLEGLEQARLARILAPVVVAAGQTVFRLGDPGGAMYFIVSGRLEADLGVTTVEMKGEFFGELGVLTEGDRSATVRAVEASELLKLDAKDVSGLKHSAPGIAERIFRLAKERLAADRRRLLGEG